MLVANQQRPIFGGDAVALYPRPDGVDRGSGQGRNLGSTRSLDDLAVTSHGSVMPFAFSERKGEMHNGLHYASHMTDPAERLRIARLRAGFTTGKEAAEAMGIPVATYLGHENGSRGISAKRATQYSKRFKVPEVWLLYGTGPGPGTEAQGESGEIVQLINHMKPERRAEALRYLRFLAGNGEG